MSQRSPLDNFKPDKEISLPLFFKEAYEASPAVVREAALVATALPACFIHGAEESWNDPKGTFDRVVSAVGIGLVLGVVTRRPRALLKIAAECRLPLAQNLSNDAKAIMMIKSGGHIAAHAFGTIPFLMEAAQPERLKAVGTAFTDTWQSNKVDTLYQSRDKVAHSWGRFVFDSAAMLPAAKVGDYIGIKSIDHLRRGPQSPQFALATTFNAFPVNTKAEKPLIDTHLNMVAQDSAPHKRPGTDAHKTYAEFNKSLGEFAEIRNSIAELQKAGSNLNEANDLWKAAHELIKLVLLSKTSKRDYEAALNQMSLMNKKFTSLLDGKGTAAAAAKTETTTTKGMIIRRPETIVQRALPKAIMDAKLSDVQVRAFENFVKQSRSLTDNLDNLNLPAEEAQSLSHSVKTGIKIVTALAAESQNPLKRPILDSCLDNMARATEVMDSIAKGTFQGRELQARTIVKLLNSHIANLDQHLAINFEKASSHKAQLKSLNLYADLIEQIALKTFNTKDTGHKYETQVTKQIQDALKTSSDHKVYVPAQNYSLADSVRMDGIFIDLAKDQIIPVDFGLSPQTIAHKVIQSKGLWALHLPKGQSAETIACLKSFETGSYYFEPLVQAAKTLAPEFAAVLRQKIDVEHLTQIEGLCKSANEVGILKNAKEQFASGHAENKIARQRLVDSLNALAISAEKTNPQLRQSITTFLSGSHYANGLAKLASALHPIKEAGAFIRGVDNDISRSAFQTLFMENRNCLLFAGRLLGLRTNETGFEPPIFDLSNFHSKLGEGTPDSLPLPQFRFDPLAAAENSVNLIKHYENFVDKHPDNALGQYLLKCAKDAELHKDSVSQIGSALAIGLAANKMAVARGEKLGLSLGISDFKKGFDVNGQYLSYDLGKQARRSLRESEMGGAAHQTNAIRIYNDGNVRMVYYSAKNGTVTEQYYELGPFEYWNQLASALLQKKQSLEPVSPIENNADTSKNLLSLVEALELGLEYERTKLVSVFFNELKASGWLNDGKSHTENAPVAAAAKPSENISTQIRALFRIAGRDVEVAHSARIPQSQFGEALLAYQGVKKANLMSLNLPDMCPTAADRPADKAFNFISRETGSNYKIFEFNAKDGMDVVVMSGSKLLARFRVISGEPDAIQ